MADDIMVAGKVIQKSKSLFRAWLASSEGSFVQIWSFNGTLE
jgi:hypothetical protein